MQDKSTRIVHTVTLEDQGMTGEPIPPKTPCCALMTTGTRKGSRDGRSRGRYTVHGKAKRLPCPMLATRLIDGSYYCDVHGPSRWRIDPYYATPEWKNLRTKALERDNHTCRYCGMHAIQADHIVARSKGGSDSLDNLAACCPICNKIAAGNLFASFAAKKRFILAARKALKLSPKRAPRKAT